MLIETAPCLVWLDENRVMQRRKIIDRIFIGRTCKGIVDSKRIILCHPDVSRDHAEISLTDSCLQLTDRSRNGTWVDNVRIASGSTVLLSHGSVVRVGDTLINVSYQGPTSMSGSGSISEQLSSLTRIRYDRPIVTHLVADIRGFTDISQELGSEQLYVLVKEIFVTLSRIVSDNKGTIKDYAGDAIYAFWEHGIDTCKEQAVMACKSAIKQVQVVRELRTKLCNTNPILKQLKLGWGITTGQITLSNLGTRASDIVVVGDSTNLAFRLSSIANKDFDEEIIICSKTACLVQGTLELKSLGLIPIRGHRDQQIFYAIKL